MLQYVPVFCVSHYFLSMRPRLTQGYRAGDDDDDDGDDDDYYLSVIQSTLLVKTVKGKKLKLSLCAP